MDLPVRVAGPKEDGRIGTHRNILRAVSSAASLTKRLPFLRPQRPDNCPLAICRSRRSEDLFSFFVLGPGLRLAITRPRQLWPPCLARRFLRLVPRQSWAPSTAPA